MGEHIGEVVIEQVEKAIAEYQLTRDRIYPGISSAEVITEIQRMGCTFTLDEPYSPYNTCNS